MVTVLLTKERLFQMFDRWEQSMDFSVRLIACGGAALMLLNLKPATPEIDLIAPDAEEYAQLLRFLPTIGFYPSHAGWQYSEESGVVYRFWSGKQVLTTELLTAPLKLEDALVMKVWPHVSLGVLTLMDLLITQLFRGTEADLIDCIAIFKTWQVDAEDLLERYAQMSSAAPQADQKMQTFMAFVAELVSHHLVSDEFLEKVTREKNGLFEKSVVI